MRSIKHLASFECYRYFQWTDQKEATEMGFLWWAIKHCLWVVTKHQFDKLICIVTSHDWQDWERTFVEEDSVHFTDSYDYECQRCGKER